MSQPIALSDDELQAVMDAARPLQPRDRDRFLRAVAHAIAELPVVGPGSVHRAIATVWRGYFNAPDLRIRSWGEPDMPGWRE
jgi:hypothetical protein